MGARFAPLAGLVAAAAFLPITVGAQSGGWLPRLRLDNDAYNFWKPPARRPDEEYTNGVAATLENLDAPVWGRLVGRGKPPCAGAEVAQATACMSTTVTIGQDIYTPHLDRPPYAFPDWRDERPYAAWLYLGTAGRVIADGSLRTVEVAVGVTGPPALGDLSQRVAHFINERYTTKAEGWDTQVGFEPGFIASARQSLLAARGQAGGRGIADLVYNSGVTIGNVRSAADMGGRLRVGYNLSHPWDARRWRRRPPLETFAVVGGRLEYVARDFSLDGTLFSDSRRVARVPLVREYEVGIGLRMHRLALTWTATTRSQEYRTGPSFHAFSSMQASWEH
ncbi:MAG: lipid A deacylase LpxR family protein [Gemmatimonadota bacterium]